MNLIVNVMGPMHDGGTHVDAPTYRGLQRAEAPLWLLVVMGMSGLFERWAVRVWHAETWLRRLERCFPCLTTQNRRGFRLKSRHRRQATIFSLTNKGLRPISINFVSSAF